MSIYLILKEGVYIQGVAVEHSLEKAVEKAAKLAILDKDDYHEYCVYKYDKKENNGLLVDDEDKAITRLRKL